LNLTGSFCAQKLDDDYNQLCKKLILKLGRKRDVPFKSGKIEIWAAAIVHSLGSINFLFDNSFEPYVTAEQISEYFGTKKSTVSNKAKQIKDMFGLVPFDRDFSTQYIKDNNPYNDMISGMVSIQDELGLDDKQFGMLRLFNRILISYNDFKQAHEIASLLLDGGLYQNYPRENRHLVIALNMAAIVAYSRPFLDSRGALAHNKLPGRILRNLSTEELELHETVLKDRNTMMAHSDADANEAIPLILETERGPVVIPKNASAYATLLLPEAMRALKALALKLQERCFALKREMEPAVLPFLPRVEVGSADNA